MGLPTNPWYRGLSSFSVLATAILMSYGLGWSPTTDMAKIMANQWLIYFFVFCYAIFATEDLLLAIVITAIFIAVRYYFTWKAQKKKASAVTTNGTNKAATIAAAITSQTSVEEDSK